MGDQRIAEDLGGDMGVGGAARMGEQACVIGLRGGGRVAPKPVGESSRDQCRVQPVLEREAHAEVGGQAERADHLGRTDPLGGLLDHSRIVPHASAGERPSKTVPMTVPARRRQLGNPCKQV